MSEQYVSLGLVVLLIFQQVYSTITINRLVNKLMSRNYGEYMQSQVHTPDRLNVKLNEDPAEDLNAIFNIGPQV